MGPFNSFFKNSVFSRIVEFITFEQLNDQKENFMKKLWNNTAKDFTSKKQNNPSYSRMKKMETEWSIIRKKNNKNNIKRI